MAENQKEQDESAPSGVNKMPFIVLGAVVIVACFAIFSVFMMKSGPEGSVEAVLVEYVVPNKLYQLKDGSYLKLGFSIVVNQDHLESIRKLVEEDSPGRLPDGIKMILGNKGREDLINGTHQRQSFSLELKKC